MGESNVFFYHSKEEPQEKGHTTMFIHLSFNTHDKMLLLSYYTYDTVLVSEEYILLYTHKKIIKFKHNYLDYTSETIKENYLW